MKEMLNEIGKLKKKLIRMGYVIRFLKKKMYLHVAFSLLKKI